MTQHSYTCCHLLSLRSPQRKAQNTQHHRLCVLCFVLHTAEGRLKIVCALCSGLCESVRRGCVMGGTGGCCLNVVCCICVMYVCIVYLYVCMYIVGSKSFRPDQLFKVTEIKQLCYFAT